MSGPRPPCTGSANVIPVPRGMTAEQAWDEITTIGRLHRKPPKHGLTWACVECAGGADCRCRYVDRSPTWWCFHNDRLTAARVAGVPMPSWALPTLARLQPVLRSLRFGGVR